MDLGYFNMDKSSILIPSIIHQATISSLCSHLKLIGNIKYFVLYIIFNDGKKFVISNTPQNFLLTYWDQKLNITDHSSDQSLFLKNNHFLCNENLGADIAFKELLESKFQMYRTFYATRKCAECRFVFGAIHDRQILDPSNFYKANIGKFENFCIDFIDNSIDLIKLYNPEYNRSIILNDKSYRKSVIKMNIRQHQPLTERELECLYWAAQGKSSTETAIILNIKKYTVEEYRKNIKQKLNCSTIAQAIYEGVKMGYIGAFHRLSPEFFTK